MIFVVNSSIDPMTPELDSAEVHLCYQYMATHFPAFDANLFASQGWCSYTFLLQPADPLDNEAGPNFILQFRKNRFAINCAIANDARDVYGSYVPVVQELSPLCAPRIGLRYTALRSYRMSLIPGIQYSSIAPQGGRLTGTEFDRQMALVQDFADFIARGWKKQSPDHPQPLCSGKVGSNIQQKLQQAAQRLPSGSLRALASRALSDLGLLSSLPVSLNHGDLIPSNIIINPDNLRLNGVVDWAEAEYLPFGTCLYGLEYFLGSLMADEQNHRWQFRYYERAFELRLHFWCWLYRRLPMLRDGAYSRALIVAKKVGIILWYGFAWDDGAIDRVVNGQDDPTEVACLTAFLAGLEDDRPCITVAPWLSS